MSGGRHRLVWNNVKGGGISLDAFVLTRDAGYEPADDPPPVPAADGIVLQAEDVARFDAKQGQLPGRLRAAVWLAGDGAAIDGCTVAGTAQVSHGIVVASPDPLGWVRNCRVTDCRVVDVEGKDFDTCGVRLIRADGVTVVRNQLWGRTPLYLSGVRRGDLSDNLLVPITRFGGNSEAAIQGRNEVIEECLVADNIVASPDGAEAGGPQTRRLIWVSTGRGSVSKNCFRGNEPDATVVIDQNSVEGPQGVSTSGIIPIQRP
jgi:hypothetical protein